MCILLPHPKNNLSMHRNHRGKTLSFKYDIKRTNRWAAVVQNTICSSRDHELNSHQVCGSSEQCIIMRSNTLLCEQTNVLTENLYIKKLKKKTNFIKLQLPLVSHSYEESCGCVCVCVCERIRHKNRISTRKSQEGIPCNMKGEEELTKQEQKVDKRMG